MMGISRLKNILEKPVSPVSLEIFRIIAGTLFFVIILRFYLYGWIDEFLVSPDMLFPYYGFAWIPRPGFVVIYGIFALAALSALGVMLGLWYRFSTLIFFLCFTYTESLEKTIYLNHYYFVSLLSFCMIFLPAGKFFCVKFKGDKPKYLAFIPFFWIVILRIQIGSVYFFAGIAKLKPDWLLEGLPLGIWLRPYFEVISSYLPVSAKFMAQSGGGLAAAFDFFVPFLLCNQKTRPVAYAGLIGFHIFTWFQFHLGMFPILMTALTLIFFPPNWPRKLFKFLNIRLKAVHLVSVSWKKNTSLHPFIYQIFFVFFMIQMFLPFRYLLYPGNVLWNEQGFRFSWNVMLMEKSGYLRYRFKLGSESTVVYPEDMLTPLQYKMVSTQPDMILQLAHWIRDRHQRSEGQIPEVFADAFVSLNGRPSRRFIDPEVDLSGVEEHFYSKPWILPETVTNHVAGDNQMQK